MNHKHILILSMIFMLTSCGQSSTDKNEKTKTDDSSAEISPSVSPENQPEPPKSEKRDYLKELAGHYRNVVEADPALTGVKMVASIDVVLSENGTFKGTESVMGVSSSVKGTWAYADDVVALNWNGHPWKLAVGLNGQTLTDEQEGIQLQKQ